jgi:hypothetical protein
MKHWKFYVLVGSMMGWLLAGQTDDVTARPVTQLAVYCCGNHTPKHCVKADKIAECSRLHGCKNWQVELPH